MEPDKRTPLKSPQPKTQHPPGRAVDPLADGLAPAGAAGAFLVAGVEAIFAQGGKGYNFYTSKGGKPLFRGGMPPLTPHVLHLCFLTNPQRAFLCQSPRGSKLRRLKRLRAGGGPLPRLSLLRAQADQWNSWIKGVVSEAGTRHLAARLDPM